PHPAAPDPAPRVVPRSGSLALLPLQIGHQTAFGTSHDLHEFPALIAPIVEDRGRVVHHERCRHVLPGRHVGFRSASSAGESLTLKPMSAQKRTVGGVFGAIAGMLGFSAIAGVLVTVMVTPAIAVTGMTATT